jgi:geranylgeranyl diphosphate synthase type II
MDKLSSWKEKIELRLRELFKPREPEILTEAMSYYLFQPGKRIRPLLTVAVSSALGGREEDAITVGCVIEMIHNYSLIHDDLPAMDNDDFRRGLPSCHKKFGEAVAILAGDALLTYAFEVLSDIKSFEGLSPESVLRIVNTIAVKSGVGGMVGGQALDISGEENLEEVNLRKTAALFEACFLCGAILSQREDILPDLEELGRGFGLLFQITDDILDGDGYCALLGRERAVEKATVLYSKLEKDIRALMPEGYEVLTLLRKVYNRIT